MFLSFDIYIQHIFGSDLFGFPPIDERYNGIFNDEAIAGGYIQKFSLLSILAIFLFKTSNNIKKILLIIIGNILAIGTLLSLDRMPFIVIIFGFFMLIFFIKKPRFILFLNFFIILLIFIFFIEIYSPIKKRYFDLNKELNISKITNSILQNNNNNNNNNDDDDVGNFKITEETLLIGGYGQIFNSALYVYKYNWLIGTGTKSFQKKCYKLSETKKNLSCPPHPHNIYLEILINTGIVGFLIFLIFVINIIINLLRSNNINDGEKKYISYFFLIIIICELIPLRSYGSIFQTVTGSLFWFLLSIISSYTFMSKNFNK